MKRISFITEGFVVLPLLYSELFLSYKLSTFGLSRPA